MFQLILILAEDEPAAVAGQSERLILVMICFVVCTVFLHNYYYYGML